MNLTSIVKTHGRIPHFKLKPFFDNANVGISYIPITDYYEHQPPTKTYEYILSGIPCLATNTHENIKIINEINGALCNDNPNSFAEGLMIIHKNELLFNSEEIRETLKNHTWKSIVNNILKPTLKGLKKTYK